MTKNRQTELRAIKLHFADGIFLIQESTILNAMRVCKLLVAAVDGHRAVPLPKRELPTALARDVVDDLEFLKALESLKD